jgi:hypothetical protein
MERFHRAHPSLNNELLVEDKYNFKRIETEQKFLKQ